jgi:hypothetical protein
VRSNLVWSGVSLVIGLLLGQLFVDSPAPSPVVASVIPASLPPVERPLSRADIAAAVRAELARARPAEAPAVEQAVAATQAEPHDDGARATQVVGSALSRGRWTDADRTALFDAMEELPRHLKAEVTAELADAINRGVVSVDVEGFPL